MKQFKFQFETLEKVRKARENEALRVLSEAQAKFFECMREKERLIEAMNRALSRREQLGTDTAVTPAIGVMPLQLEDSFIEGQKHRVLRQDQQILRAKKKVDQAMRGYLVARRATRMMERLREKAMEEYKLAAKRWEQRELDDLILMRSRMKEDGGLGANAGSANETSVSRKESA